MTAIGGKPDAAEITDPAEFDPKQSWAVQHSEGVVGLRLPPYAGILAVL
jgi:hypothetical protein